MEASGFLDWVADHVSPLSPRPIIIPDLRVAEEVCKNKPAEGRPFADSAIGYDFLIRCHALALVEFG